VFDEESLVPEVLELLFLIVQRFSVIDSLKNLVLTEGGYRKIALSLSKVSHKSQCAVVRFFGNTLSRGEDIRKQVTEGKASLLNALDSLTSVTTEEGIRASGSTLALFSNFPDSENSVIKAKEILFAAMKGNDLPLRNLAFACLTEAAMPEVRSRLLELGCKEVVQPFVEDDKSDANFVSVLITALLFASDVNEKKQNRTEPHISCHYFKDHQRPEHFYHLPKKGHFFDWELRLLLRTDLACNTQLGHERG